MSEAVRHIFVDNERFTSADGIHWSNGRLSSPRVLDCLNGFIASYEVVGLGMHGYYRDIRLREYRRVSNPDERIPFAEADALAALPRPLDEDEFRSIIAAEQELLRAEIERGYQEVMSDDEDAEFCQVGPF